MAFFSVEKTKPLLGNLIDLIWQNNNDSYFFSSRGFHIDILLFVGYTYNLTIQRHWQHYARKTRDEDKQNKTHNIEN
jgi:hypothetical protein